MALTAILRLACGTVGMAGHSQISRNRWPAGAPAVRMAGLSRILTIADMREAAQRRLPRVIFDFVDGAAEDELGKARQHRRARRRPGDAELPDRYPRAQPEDGPVRADLGPPGRNRADRHEQPAVARRGPVPGARRHGGQRALYPQHRGDDIDRGYRRGDRGPVLVPALRPERPGNQPGPRPAGARGGRAGPGAHRRRALARQARARPAQRLQRAVQDDAENAARRRPPSALGAALPRRSGAAPRHHRRLRPGGRHRRDACGLHGGADLADPDLGRPRLDSRRLGQGLSS